MNIEKKQVPIDGQSFRDIIGKKFYYVDKTKFIKDIVTKASTTMLFTRPRRFGKSVTLDMLKCFLEINYKDPLDTSFQQNLFKDLEIFKDKDFCSKHMGKYPIITLSFKDAWNVESKELALQKIFEELGFAADEIKGRLNLNKLSKEQEAKLNELVALSDENVSAEKKQILGTSFLKILTKLLFDITGQKAIILVDEYDVPLSKSSRYEFYENVKNAISNVFSAGLKNNNYLEKGIITGCLKVAKESIFTGLNNFYACGLENSDFAKLFGFDNTEVKELLTYYGLDDKLKEYQEWYDGYNIGGFEIFCPWDVIYRTNALLVDKKQVALSYWGGTGNIELLQKVFASNPKLYAEQLQSLLDGGEIIVNLADDINYEILNKSKNPDHFWNVLFSSGYLTLSTKGIQSLDSGTKISLRIPYKSVRREVVKAVNWCFTPDNPKYLKSLDELIAVLKTDQSFYLEDYINKTLLSYVSLYDTQKGTDKESLYHAFLNGRLSAAFDFQDDDYASNIELGNGSPDICFTMLKNDNDFLSEKLGFILELKVSPSDEKLRELAQKAISQVKEKHYADALFAKVKRVNEIRVFGIAFFKKTCAVELKIIKRS